MLQLLVGLLLVGQRECDGPVLPEGAGDSIDLVSHVVKEVHEGKEVVHIHIHLSSCSETTTEGQLPSQHWATGQDYIVLNVGGSSSLGLHP